ncbi:glycoside hydrolase family 92 protein [Apiospora phragmitis]|uniref:Glycoside hydrolase family 92 protein n=1 Tax=Apiospora phragmitis TaxID=2905665 RepID=A0ABR1VVU2_9PEZI
MPNSTPHSAFRLPLLLLLLSLLSLLANISTALAAHADDGDDILRLINPLIGSTNGGNVFAGATRPYALAKPVANVDGQNTGGFATDGSKVTGFSAVHDLGTGGNPSLGNFPLFPQVCPQSGDDGVNSCQFRIGDRAPHYVNDSVVAEPGRFAVELVSGVKAQMTSSEHAALYRFEFPTGGGGDPLVLLDLTDLWQSRQNASVSVDAFTGQLKGNGTFLPSFGAGSYVMHFCVDFHGGDVRDNGVWVNNRAGTEPKSLYVTRGFNLFFVEAGDWVRFQNLANNTLTARMGLSFISTEQACNHAATEIPKPLTDFDRLVSETQDAWRQKLSPISIKAGGASEDLQSSFWSGIYRGMISPQNYTGENPHWDSGIPYFDSYYCIWDAFRVQHPLLTILDPVAQSQMVNSLLDIYKHEGWLPDCHMSMCSGLDTGWLERRRRAAIIQDAEVEPLEWSYQGRGGLQSWKSLDYIPYLDFDPLGFGTNSRSVSRTLEYAYNDYCLATLAQGLGKADVYDKYIQRSTNWRNIWKEDQTSAIQGNDTGFKGFFQPKYMNGTWGYQDPIACSALADFCSLTTNPSETFEASIWQYQFLVPQQISTLISLMGGDEEFISRLDFFHTSGLADISNEPVFSTVYLYHYAGRPALSTKRLHTYIPSRFRNTNDGLPGNDDSGSMGAFVVFGIMGLFPIAGQNVYLISAPFFEELRVTHGVTGKTATVRVVGGFDPAYANVSIQSVTVNGEPWTRNWITHELFTEGWTMEITLGAEESAWGTRPEDRPPSRISGS